MKERLTTYHCGKAVIKDKNKLSEAMEKLAKLEDEEEHGGWIPCSERMPKGTVLCCDDRGNILVGLLCKGEARYTAYGDDGQAMYNCVAWMTLPEPFKEEEHEQTNACYGCFGAANGDCDECAKDRSNKDEE